MEGTNRTPARAKNLLTGRSLPVTCVRVALRALVRPRLIFLLLGAAWRFRRRDWYRRAPFLPLPPADYMRWRLHTAYGDETATPTPAELESYLSWSASMRRRNQD